jgi:hypothetical protein
MRWEPGGVPADGGAECRGGEGWVRDDDGDGEAAAEAERGELHDGVEVADALAGDQEFRTTILAVAMGLGGLF